LGAAPSQGWRRGCARLSLVRECYRIQVVPSNLHVAHVAQCLEGQCAGTAFRIGNCLVSIKRAGHNVGHLSVTSPDCIVVDGRPCCAHCPIWELVERAIDPHLVAGEHRGVKRKQLAFMTLLG
jgi:hypothetical protein